MGAAQAPPRVKISYTPTAEAALLNLADYIFSRFGEAAEARFYDGLLRFEATIATTPMLYPPGDPSGRVRRAVVHPRTIILYEVVAGGITVLDAWDTRQDR